MNLFIQMIIMQILTTLQYDLIPLRRLEVRLKVRNKHTFHESCKKQ